MEVVIVRVQVRVRIGIRVRIRVRVGRLELMDRDEAALSAGEWKQSANKQSQKKHTQSKRSWNSEEGGKLGP